MLTDKAVSAIADKVLREALPNSGYERVSVRSGLDDEDKPALFIGAILKRNVPAVSGETINSALAALREALLQNDEARFPYLRLVHPDDVYAEGWPPNGSRGRTRRAHG